MSTKRAPGPFDCYAKADADEPLFVLLGRDRHAPLLVELWAALRELDTFDPAKVAEARTIADDMRQWRITGDDGPFRRFPLPPGRTSWNLGEQRNPGCPGPANDNGHHPADPDCECF